MKIIVKKFIAFLLLFFFLSIKPVNFSFAQEIFVVAKVNNQVITNIDLLDRYRFLLTISKIKVSSKEEKLLFFNQLLQKMIDEKLQSEEAAALGISLTPEELDGSLEKIAAGQKKTTKQLQNFFSANSISYSNYIKQIESQILWGKIMNEVLSSRIKISTTEIEELIELNKIDANITQYFLSEIYVPFDYKISNNKIDAKELAQKLSSELKRGKNFKNLVKQFSRSPTAEFDGEIGWVGKNDINIKVYEQISKLKADEVSNPVAMNDGYYIFKVAKKRVVSNLKDEDIKQIKNIIFNKKLQITAKSYLMDIRKKSYVEIDQEKLKLMLF